MAILHQNLAAGGWEKFSLIEQLANIGSEVGRARVWQRRDEKVFAGAVDRALELFDLTIADSRWQDRLKEIARVREFFCDAIFGINEYGTNLEDLEKYFLQFAIAARLHT